MLRWNEMLRISLRLRRDPESVTVAERVYQKFLIAKQLEDMLLLRMHQATCMPKY
jgi:hypothetical protein